MSESIPTITKSRSRLGVATKAGDAEAATEARKDLAAAKIAAYIERTLAEAPPLSAEQRSQLASILAPVVAGGASA